ncbi:hypothetical protein [Aureimonas sp. N4]|uniref:hypothetical protein n=1 Tax=Aureimonas sp. N4 TaxID=1638165 RepID=UPI000781B17E|nr:hypothetical protein [Aureimonas sp. N4]
MSETKGAITGRPWTDAERVEMRRLLATGSTMRQTAEALGRPITTVQSMASRAGLVAWDRILPSTKEGILHFAAQGWSSRRIGQRFKVPAEFVDHVAGRTGA